MLVPSEKSNKAERLEQSERGEVRQETWSGRGGWGEASGKGAGLYSG